jgi:hypothetical protein
MTGINKFLNGLLPKWLKNILKPIKVYSIKTAEYYTIKMTQYKQKKALIKVRLKSKNERIKVAFFALSSAVWKYEGIYRLMETDQRFEVIILICPIVNFGRENMLLEMKKAYKYFSENGYNTIKTYDENTNKYLDIKRKIQPDIIFYTNPYKGLILKKYYITNFKNYLTCYAHYSFRSANRNNTHYNQLFQNLLWKAFSETKIHNSLAITHSRNKGKNVELTGYPGLDYLSFFGREKNNVWKNPDTKLKRIIWAPHHTIEEKGELHYSNFFKYHQFMLDIAKKYKDKIQIAFKPHPMLQAKLFIHDDWGKYKTEKYFNMWNEGENTQAETDDYIDLFNTSDALILDSHSFIVEYLCCNKPSLFQFADKNVRDRLNIFGKMAIEQHYSSEKEEDVVRFIENVVIKGEDTMCNQRETFFNSYLKAPNNVSASKNIFNVICKEIF